MCDRYEILPGTVEDIAEGREQAGLIGGNHLNWGPIPPIDSQNCPPIKHFYWDMCSTISGLGCVFPH